MFKRLHPFTCLGVLLGACSMGFFLIGHRPVGLLLVFLAYGFTLLEFKTYTSSFQFTMLLVLATMQGVVLDLAYHSWPWLTCAGLTAATATIARQAFMQQFTYVGLLWLDTGMALLGLGFYIGAVAGTTFHWEQWLLPLLPVGVALGLTGSYVQDARHMRLRTRFGYRVQVGMVAPDFELPDAEGCPVRLSDLRGRHPVLVLFVRGDWCPGCHMMLRTYERGRARFLEKGVHVLAVGPDDIAVNREMVRRIGVGFSMLSDKEQQVSGTYGVIYGNPVIEMGVDYAEGIPLPASFLIDTDGVVRYVSRPDRVGEFLDPELVFTVLDRLPPSGTLAWN
ncbi:MAG: redoxin domain-containing protein [Flavobacteriales bacterium]|nr:redoxin domain-containing protein [Flavobacteriales bacterium]